KGKSDETVKELRREAFSTENAVGLPRCLLIRNPNFRRVWLGQILSQAGSRAYFINLLWWTITQGAAEAGVSETWASGILLTIMGLPQVVLLKPIGSILGRYSTKLVMITAELIGGTTALVVLIVSLLGFLNLGIVMAASLIIAICQAFVDPAIPKSVPELVASADIDVAVGYEASTQALAFFSGAGLGAIASGTLGFNITIALNAASYGLSALLTSRAKFSEPMPTRPMAADFSVPQSVGAPLAEPDSAMPEDVRPLLYSFASANFFMFPIFLLLPLTVKQNLHGNVLSLGILEASFWLGLIAGAAVSPRLKTTYSNLKLCGVAFMLFGLLLTIMALTLPLLGMAIIMVIGGLTAGFINVRAVSYFQRVVPQINHGRFFAKLQAFVVGAQPLSYFLFTLLVGAYALSWGFLCAGLGLLFCGIYAFRAST
ncbi:MAG: MFS transporter, partial [Proteobacteria bacterium]|nr:MFS transporter [Pseudomonadota bacterium]